MTAAVNARVKREIMGIGVPYQHANYFADQFGSGQYVTATGGDTRTLADWTALLDGAVTFNGDPTGVEDSSTALASAIAEAEASHLAGSPKIVRIPSGHYRVVTPPPMMTRPVAIIGDGPYRTFIELDSSFVGDLFSYSDVWYASNYDPSLTTIASITNSLVGPRVEGMTIYGDTAAAGVQNGLVFYDHCDEIILRDLDIFYLNGRALYFGPVSAGTNGYCRESFMENIRVSNCGALDKPAVEITSTGTGDSTNTLTFIGLSIFASLGVGLKIWGDNANKDTSTLRFYNLRVEGSLGARPTEAGNLVEIGASAGAGGVRNCDFYGFIGAASISTYYTIAFLGASSSKRPLSISVEGVIVNGSGGGINVDAGRNLRFRMIDLSTTETEFKVGSSTLVAPIIYLDANGLETTIAYDIDATSVASVFTAARQEIGTNGQVLLVRELSELLTIAAAATTDTTMNLPAGAVILGVPVRVVTVIPTAANFTVTGATSGTTFSTAAVAVAANTTNRGTAAGAYYNASNQKVRITPDLTPAAATGQVRVSIYYVEITPPTS